MDCDSRAARYQIMEMCMIFGSMGISVAMFLLLIKSNFKGEIGGNGLN